MSDSFFLGSMKFYRRIKNVKCIKFCGINGVMSKIIYVVGYFGYPNDLEQERRHLQGYAREQTEVV